jgi:hypothetical protein
MKEELVLPDRIELLRSGTSLLKNHEFFDPLTLAVYQLGDHS